MRRRALWITLGILVLAGVGSGMFSPSSPISVGIHAVKPKAEKKQQPITVALVGDIMLDRGVARSVAKNFNGDYGALFANVPELAAADIAFGNLEGPVAAGGRNVGSQYSFRMSPEILPALKAAGFDVFSFANNHVGDWSKDAFVETLSYLERAGFQYAGAGDTYADAVAPRIMTVQGKKIGFLAFTDVGPNWLAAKTEVAGVALASDPNLSGIIADAKSHADYLFVSFHFGDEYNPVTARQKKLARQAVDAGADVVVGAHPHVIQATEEYNGKPIFYSLGNFIFDQYFSPETMRGGLVLVTITPEGKISFEEKTVDLNTFYQPQAPRPRTAGDAVLVAKAVPFSCPKPKTLAADYFLLPLPSETVDLKNYIPNNLVQISRTVTGGADICLTKETYTAYQSMLTAMKKEKVEAHVFSGFRDAAMQRQNLQERGDSIAAAVGQSEHHLGTTIDFTSGTVPVKFIESPEYTWLQEHAWEYGFVQSYRPGQGDANKGGAGGESWHWRYVGKTHAKKIHREDVPLKEYLENL
ncbi:MAG TPA: CapA family protein [Candidatus Paceibacterota bacterium]|nr:CapA family protein [Candidatus Paceibacterota bacterium]